MQRTIRTLVAATLALAGACGGDKSPESQPAASAPATPAPAAAVATVASNVDSIGKAVYATCVTCHQLNGEGVAGAFPPLAKSDIVTGRPEIPIAIVLHGLSGPITVAGKEYNGVMTPWGAMFDDVQVAAVLTYVRSQWGNAAPAVTPEQVAAVRKATASRTTMWTWAELQAMKF